VYLRNVGSNPNRSVDTLLHDLKDKKQIPNRTKQKFSSTSLQPSLRCQTLAFLPLHPLRGNISAT